MAGKLLETWAVALVALYPPAYREEVGDDLRLLLVDRARACRKRGRGALLRFLLSNTAICIRDAAAEWVGAVGRTLTEVRRGGMGTNAMYELRLAIKGLLRRPGYSIPVLLTLVLGIGANTATFTVLDSVVLRPLPYPESDRIVRVTPFNDERGGPSAFSLPDVRDWERRASAVSALGAYGTLNSDLVHTGGGQAVELETAYVTAGFFGAMGARPSMGRVPTEEEEFGDNRVIVVSHAFWLQSLGGDPAAVGRTLPLSGDEFTVVGVMPPSFAFPSARTEVWAFLSIIPASSTPYHIRAVRLLEVVARMADGASIEQVRDDLSSVARALATAYPDSNEGITSASVRPLRDHIVGEARTPLVILMAAAGLILLITWANLTNLALAREAQRGPELAVRAALGASRLRRAGLVLTECLLLSSAAGVLGLLLAVAGTELLVASGGALLPRAHEITPDWRVAGFTLLVAVVTGVAVAAMASVRAGRADLAERLRASGRGQVAGSARGFLVVSQVSLSLVLLVGATLLLKSLDSLGRVDVGFDPEGLVTAYVTFGSDRFPTAAEYLPRFDATMAALSALPGVRSVSSVRRFPFRGDGEGLSWNHPAEADDVAGTRARLLQVGPDFFETMGIAFVEGGDFAPADVASGRPVMVVGVSVAREAFPVGSAVGRVLRVGGDEVEIVGVVEDVRQSDLRGDPAGILYVPNAYNPRRAAAFVARFGPTATDGLESVRAAMTRLDSGQPITELALASEIVDEQLARDRFVTMLLVIFAGLALTLCAVGVYAVVAYGVSRRKREVGIRLALGAEPSEVRTLVVRQGMRPVMVGIVVGVALTFVASGALERLLFSVGRFEAAAYAGSSVLLAALGVVACWLPARSVAGSYVVDALGED